MPAWQKYVVNCIQAVDLERVARRVVVSVSADNDNGNDECNPLLLDVWLILCKAKPMHAVRGPYSSGVTAEHGMLLAFGHMHDRFDVHGFAFKDILRREAIMAHSNSVRTLLGIMCV